MDKSGKSKLKNDPFIIQPGANLTSLYITGGEIEKKMVSDFLHRCAILCTVRAPLCTEKIKARSSK